MTDPTQARSVAELAGFACLAIAAFLLHPVIGFAVAGIALILAANFAGRLDRVPTVPAHGGNRHDQAGEVS